MNERIRELAEQAGYIDKGSNHTSYMEFDHEKFASLIVEECIKSVAETPLGYKDYRDQIEERMRDECVLSIKYKFQVE